jgi:hypothetical protein
MRRLITIQPNLAAWLRACPLEKFPILPKCHTIPRAQIRKQFGLTHDVPRHTFISMHVAKFRSMDDAALQAGNSESIIRRHYLDVKNSTEADAFFAIVPTKAAEVKAPAASAMAAGNDAAAAHVSDDARRCASRCAFSFSHHQENKTAVFCVSLRLLRPFLFSNKVELRQKCRRLGTLAPQRSLSPINESRPR